ncbi:MAG: hypothetical protein JO061_17420 [Acidobacteriaceae bacterium]|nr:hypothetical protein [Acidobacteriaceae bacterium]
MRFGMFVLLSAALAMAQDFAFQVASPVASQDFHFKAAAFVFRTTGCSSAEAPKISATAEGIISNQRQSVPLKVVEGSKPGVYAVFQSWPRDGQWLVDLTGTCGPATAGALIPVERNGFNRNSAKFFSHRPTNNEIEGSLTELAQKGNK